MISSLEPHNLPTYHEVYCNWAAQHKEPRQPNPIRVYLNDFCTPDPKDPIRIESPISTRGRDRFVRVCRIMWQLQKEVYQLYHQIKHELNSALLRRKETQDLIFPSIYEESNHYVIGAWDDECLVIITEEDESICFDVVSAEDFAADVLNLDTPRRLNSLIKGNKASAQNELESVATKIEAQNQLDKIKAEAKRLKRKAKKHRGASDRIVGLVLRRQRLFAILSVCRRLVSRDIDQAKLDIIAIPGGFAKRVYYMHRTHDHTFTPILEIETITGGRNA